MRTRTRRLTIAIAAIASLVLTTLPVAGAGPPEPPRGGVTELQIIQYSDWHGQLDPLSIFGEGTFGGAAELATYFQQDEANNPNTLIITGGDDFGASPPLSSFFDEVPAVLAQNLMGTDVSALGNHNFDKGVDHLQEMVDLAEYTYLGANLFEQGTIDEDTGIGELQTDVEGVEPYKIFHFPGVKVAVIGVTNEEAPTLVFPDSFGDIEVGDAAAAAQEIRDRLARRGVDVFILVAHDGIRTLDPPSGELIDLANEVEGFDLILGDHTDVQFSDTISGALVVENRSKGRTYSRISLEVKTGKGGVLEKSVEFVEPVSADVTPDPAVEAVLQPFRDELGPILNTIVGHSTVAIPRADSCGHGEGRTCESLVGNVVTDALRLTYETDFAITNSGGLRSDLTCPVADVDTDFCPPFTPPPYPITQGQVLTVLPFGNVVATVEVTGAELKAFLERGVSAMPGADGRFAQVSGLCFTYDITAAVGSQVTGAVHQAADGSCTGAAVDFGAAANYTVAINDFMASGGDGYPVVIARATTREFMDQVVAAHIEAEGTISPTIQGRIECVGAGCPIPTP
ncbi:MAG TPA: 5'-nucleotidase C-terminal domain-containing protein [Acidimicrobiia bacterium]